MNIPKLIKEAHENAIERGDYDLCDCDEGYGYNCSLCNNKTGVIQNKNIGELLMLIVSKFGEALEAHRNNRFANWKTHDEVIEGLKNNPAYKTLPSDIFNRDIKDTHEDKIADAFIRLFDLCGYLGVDTDFLYIETKMNQIDIPDNIGEFFLHLTGGICSLSNNRHIDSNRFLLSTGFTFARLIKFCQKHNIPIEKHIKAKMAYNRSLK